MNTTDTSAYNLLHAAFLASVEERDSTLTHEERPYADAYHAAIKAAWDIVRNYESDEDRAFNDAANDPSLDVEHPNYD